MKRWAPLAAMLVILGSSPAGAADVIKFGISTLLSFAEVRDGVATLLLQLPPPHN